jgi:cell division protein FtsN
MARDYKHRAEQRPRRPRAAGGKAHWQWLGIGLVVFFFAGFLLFLHSGPAPVPKPKAGKITPPPLAIEPPAVERPTHGPDQQGAKQKIGPEPPRFDFYTILPEKEVVIPDHEIKTRKREEKLSRRKPGRYTLQAGSFRSLAEADRRKAELALLGIEARVESALVNGTQWNRVKIGPFSSMNRVDKIRSRLRENRIDVVVLNSTR